MHLKKRFPARDLLFRIRRARQRFVGAATLFSSQYLSCPLLIGIIVCFHIWLVYAACHVELPTAKRPLILYSSQLRHDIKRVLLTGIQQASQALYVSIYGLSDPDILNALQTSDAPSVTIEYDPSASAKFTLPFPARAIPIKTKGLMHRKIAVIDHSLVFLGSANFTPSSLRHHGNLVLGFYHPDLARYLENPFSNQFQFELNGLQGSFFLLPDPSNRSEHKLISALLQAEKSVRIAMFTLTHEGIIQALITAKQRGVDVRVALDYYTAKGASKKAVKRLRLAGITVLCNQGQELLHYKWALIDNTHLITGSANWTRAAFSKNQDFILFLQPLTTPHTRFFQKLWRVIESESPLLE